MKYKVGDRVLIRQWDDMEKEFGLDAYGDIKCRCGFLRKMKMYCGRVLTVTHARDMEYIMKEDSNRWDWSEDMIERRADMIKSELRSGMVVETRSGEKYLVIINENGIRFMNLNGESFFDECDMNNDMTFDNIHDLDLMKVFAPEYILDDCNHPTRLIWERKIAKEMTVADIEKTLGYPVKIVKEEAKC